MRMKFKAILTERENIHEPWYDIVYEWEDVFKDVLGLKMVNNLDWGFRKSIYFRILRVFGKLWRFRPTFSFQMQARQWEGKNRANLYPCVIDFFFRNDDELDGFYRDFSRNPVVFISSKEAYEYLVSKKCPLNIHHLALSLPDKYAIRDDTFFAKEYDCAIVGRPSKMLVEFLEKYANENEDFIYIKRIVSKGEDGKDRIEYVTNKSNKVIFNGTREDYFKLLRFSKSALYSTPGIDGDRSDANSFNQVTPRFLEMIACGCHVIARFPDNADTDYYELPKMALRCDNYEKFRDLMNFARTTAVDMKSRSQYLQKHYSSVRAVELAKIMENL